jgi:signal transduction histidine kinase
MRRRLPAAALIAAAAVAAGLAGRFHVARRQHALRLDPRGALERRLAEVEARKDALAARVQSAADAAAALPDAAAALRGEQARRAALFRALEALRDRLGTDAPALAVHAWPLATVAWAGAVAGHREHRGAASLARRVYVVTGSVTTRLVATAPVASAGGPALGLATAELPLRVRRNVRNQYLRDFDRLADHAPGIEVAYVDARAAEPPRPEGAGALRRELRGPDGRTLAWLTLRPPAEALELGALREAYRRAVSSLLLLALAVWAAGGTLSAGRLLALAAGARAVLLAAGPPTPSDAAVAGPSLYGSSLLPPLLRGPLDLLATALLALALASFLFRRAAAGAPATAGPLRLLAALVAAVPVLGAAFAWVADTAASSRLALVPIPLLPASAAALALHLGLAAILAAAALLLAALVALTGGLPRSAAGRLALLLAAGTVAWIAALAWPRPRLGLPLLPALAVLAAGVAAGLLHARWLPALRRAPGVLRAALAVVGLAACGLVLHPALVHYAEKELRGQIEGGDAPLVLRQPQWREDVLGEALRRIDSLEALRELPLVGAGRSADELAFSIWSATELAALGFSSAVEVQDAAGLVVSRFALNLPPAAPEPLPASSAWSVEGEPLPLGSGGGRVLHAARRLEAQGRVFGAVHVYVKDDFWNLPFVEARDPYSVLYRTSPPRSWRAFPLTLLAWDRAGELTFSSADRPPPLTSALAERVRAAPRGIWTTLAIDGLPHHTFVFADRQGTYGIGYPRLAAGRFAADAVEAASALALLGLAALLLTLSARTLFGLPTLSLPALRAAIATRFSFRLFVAFVGLAALPLLVVQGAVRGFLLERLRRQAEDEALDRALVAKTAVENFVQVNRSGADPGLDRGLVYIASLIRADLDVFAQGRLLASSKRELFSSGLLPVRVSGSVYRALVLEGLPAVLAREGIGAFSYLVVSVPVRLWDSEPAVLSMPLALRERETEAVVSDVERALRLGSVLFLAAAAALAQTVSRRISGPIRQLTAATQRVAQGDLGARVAATSRDELRALVESFNQMASDLARQRADLERSNRLAAWAEMARQVAHEVKNPLTPIQLSAEHLRRVWADGSTDFATALRDCTRTILEQVRILRGIATEFSAFARPPVPEAGPLELRPLVDGVLAPYRSALPPGVRLEVEPGDGLPAVRADRKLIERALVNLVENALQAVGEQGTLTVRLAPAEQGVSLQVEDDGPGIDPEVRARIFEPFFSTKTGGSGLGLALVKKIAEDHGGRVSLESRPGRTVATLWLPAAAPDERLAGSRASSDQSNR